METKVRVALSYICEQMQLFPSDIKHYDFRYPDATKMMIVADETTAGVTDTFRIKIPSDIPVYNRTYSYYGKHGYDSMGIDGVELHKGSGIAEGELTVSQLSPDEYHEVWIYVYQYGNHRAYGAILLIYKE